MKVSVFNLTDNSRDHAVSAETERLFTAHQQRIFEQTDRMFAALMIVQWVSGIAAALLIAPRTWIGQTSQVHLHVWAAIFLGGAISFLPVVLALTRPGKPSTRYTIALGQMLFSSLLIHLTGGRLETHFHIFGSLAFLSFYRDWRVLVPASVIVAADHFIRGVFYPQSVFGVLTSEHWRWMEHGAWVAFENVFLVISCLRNQNEMRQIARHTAKLDASEERFRDLFENANDLIYTHDLGGNFISVNKTAEKVMGYSREEALRMNIAQVIAPEYLELARRQMMQKVTDGAPTAYEVEIITSDGRRSMLEVSTRVIYENGSPAAIQGTARDITARIKAERALKESEERYRIVTDSASDAIITIDQNNKILFANRAMKAVFGYSVEELLGANFSMLMPERMRASHQAGMNRYLERSERNISWQALELPALHKDGHEFSIEISFGEYNSDGQRLFTAVLRDITERRKTEEAIRLANERFRIAQEAIRGFIYDWDMLTGKATHTEGVTRVLGYEQEEVENTVSGWRQLIFSEDYEAATAEIERSLADGHSNYSIEYRVRHKEGYLVDILDKGLIIRNESEKPVRVVGSRIDISERKRVEEAIKKSEEYQNLFKHANDAIIIFEPKNERVLDVNDRACQMYGLSRAEFINRSLKTISRDVESGERQIEKLLADGVYNEFETIQTDSWGNAINVLINSSVIEFQGRPAILSINRDITARKKADGALRESEHRYRTLLGSMNEGLLQVDNDDFIQFANERFCEMSGYKTEELIGKKASELLLDEDGIGFIKQADERRRGGGADVYEMRLRKKNGDTIWALVGSAPVVDADGNIVGSMGVHTDITERKRAEEQLLHNALHDALTSLPNRALFLEHLRSAIDRNARHIDTTFAVLFLDFDRFKIVNDSLGHMEGDKLLILIAQRLKESLRPGDIVARLGGDEFTILLDELDDMEIALGVAARIEESLREPFSLAGREVFISASIGIAFNNGSYTRPEELLRDADIAMYHAKAAGKARHQVFSQAMHERASSRLQLEIEMRLALERGEFCLFYQPIVEIEGSRISGFESLVRWQHPQRGLIFPDEFISIAEETGLIVPLGEWVLRESCRQLRAWQRQNPLFSDLTISVNLSCKQFMQIDLAERIGVILRDTKLAARHLRLEITESHVMEDSRTAIEIMNRLRSLGIKLSIDDFGTGYSSLSYLHRLPINYLKIDRSFVSKMQSNPENAEIVRTIIMLAKNLGIEVVAEGIETNEQMEHLKNLSCKFGQGYFFSRPVSAEQVEFLLDNMTDATRVSLAGSIFDLRPQPEKSLRR